MTEQTENIEENEVIMIECAWCKTLFSPHTKNSKFCSTSCSAKYRSEMMKKNQEKNFLCPFASGRLSEEITKNQINDEWAAYQPPLWESSL